MEDRISPSSFYKARITLVKNKDKDTTRKLQINISDEYICKYSQQNI